MTRTAAVLLSFFGPAFPLILLLLFFALFDNEPPAVVMVISMAIFVIAALFMRLYFAMWYARDKGRHSALGLLALFGLLGLAVSHHNGRPKERTKSIRHGRQRCAVAAIAAGRPFSSKVRLPGRLAWAPFRDLAR